MQVNTEIQYISGNKNLDNEHYIFYILFRDSKQQNSAAAVKGEKKVVPKARSKAAPLTIKDLSLLPAVTSNNKAIRNGKITRNPARYISNYSYLHSTIKDTGIISQGVFGIAGRNMTKLIAYDGNTKIEQTGSLSINSDYNL